MQAFLSDGSPAEHWANILAEVLKRITHGALKTLIIPSRRLFISRNAKDRAGQRQAGEEYRNNCQIVRFQETVGRGAPAWRRGLIAPAAYYAPAASIIILLSVITAQQWSTTATQSCARASSGKRRAASERAVGT